MSTLSPHAIYAALSELVYRRDRSDFALLVEQIGAQKFDRILDFRRPSEPPANPIDVQQFENFIINKRTGLTAALFTVDGKTVVVFRGTDSGNSDNPAASVGCIKFCAACGAKRNAPSPFFRGASAFCQCRNGWVGALQTSALMHPTMDFAGARRNTANHLRPKPDPVSPD